MQGLQSPDHLVKVGGATRQGPKVLDPQLGEPRRLFKNEGLDLRGDVQVAVGAGKLLLTPDRELGKSLLLLSLPLEHAARTTLRFSETSFSPVMPSRMPSTACK